MKTVFLSIYIVCIKFLSEMFYTFSVYRSCTFVRVIHSDFIFIYNIDIKYFIYIYFFCFCRATPAAYRSSQARGKLELHLPTYATATATWNLNHICDLHHISQQHQIPDPLSKSRDWTHILMDTSQIHFHCTTTGNPWFYIFILLQMVLIFKF